MKKQILTLAFIALVGAAVTITGCKKPDETAPVITLTGNATVEVALNGSYTDEGATASDDKDGDISSKITKTGAVDVTKAGTYTLTYDVSDEAGNAASQVTRIVTVVIKGANMVATYSVVDLVGSSSSTYGDNITVSSTDPNKIFVSKFAYYDGGAVYFTISGATGTTVTIPQQTVVCGTPGASRTFSGTGTIAADGKTMTLSYTEVTNGTTVTGTETYTKQ